VIRLRPAPAPERVEPLTRLVEATRELMWAAGTTDVDPAELREAEELLSQASAILSRKRRDRVHRMPVTRDWTDRAQQGEPVEMAWLNPLRIPLSMRVEGRRATACFLPEALHEGPPDCLHGGFGAALLDHVLGVLVSAQGLPAFTAALELSYLSPTVLDEPAEVGGEVVAVTGRKVRTRGWIRQGDRTTIEATGLFIQPEGFHLEAHDE
jgi:acyl-coenzyme A thioesterase PaaI-like protein